MKLQELNEQLKKSNRASEKLAIKKNKDYSKDDDVHANFHRVARLCEVLDVDVRTPQGVIMFMILWKVQRLFKLTKEGATPCNEPLFDTGVDINVYNALLIGYDNNVTLGELLLGKEEHEKQMARIVEEK